MPLDPPPGVLGDDPELASLELALSTAGAGARNAMPAAPAPVFTSTLRARLLGELAAVDDRTRAALGDVAMPGSAAADRTRLQPVAARTTWRLPTILPAPRAFALAMAAVLVIGLLGIGTLRLLPTTLDGTVVAATDAQLVRDGTAVALVEGTALHAGDVVAVASGGNATLAIDRGETRLAGGAELRIVTLARGAISLEQLAGRVWHRVAVPDGTSYRVSTGMVEWTALGTAFDLERTEQPGGDEIVHAIGIEHAVRVAGPDLAATVDAGREATVVLRAGAAIDLAVDDLDPTNLVDPWLLGNARRDVGLGFDAGLLAAIEMPASPSPARSVAPSNPASSPSPSPEPSPEPSLSPAPSAPPAPSPSPSPTPEPSPKATPKPSPKPSPTPTPTPSPAIGTLTLDLQSCPGGVVLDWSPSTSERFGHYSVLRGTASFETPASYPPEPPVTAVDGTFTTERDVTSSRDASGTADTKYFYRALAFDAEDRVIAASPLKSATARAIKALGALDAVPGAGQVELGWSPYGGSEACFTYYKVVWSTTTKTPSYLGEHDGAIPLGSQSDASLTVDGLEPGAYWLRVQAIRTTDLGKFIVAQTSVAKVLVP